MRIVAGIVVGRWYLAMTRRWVSTSSSSQPPRSRAIDADGLPWDDVDTPAALIRTEMRHRKQRREQSIRALAPPPGAAPGQVYAFQTGAPATTEVVVRRGWWVSALTIVGAS